jgi:hypothetical protein
MKLKQYVVAMEACNSKNEWVWMIELFPNKTQAKVRRWQNDKSIKMFPSDYRNNQMIQEIELDFSPFEKEKQ